MLALDYSDVLVCRLMRGQISIGTPMELYHVVDRLKKSFSGPKIILITDMQDSVYMQYISNWATLAKDVDAAILLIKEMAGI